MRDVDPETDAVAAILATMPDVVGRITERHVPDARSRCVACGRSWPCPPARAASRAYWLIALEGA